MRLLTNNSWARRGNAILWDSDSLVQVASADQVVSVRTFFMLQPWPEQLPCGGGDALVVAGLDGCLDALTPEDAIEWLERDVRTRILQFQDEYEGQAALIFWMPSGRNRIVFNRATASYNWRCAPPYGSQTLPFGQCLWGGAEADAGRILKTESEKADPDGQAWIGLHHPRIS